jgi:hypothetical protein
MTSSPRPPDVGGRLGPSGGTTVLGGESAPARGYLLDNARAEAGEGVVLMSQPAGTPQGRSHRGEHGPVCTKGTVREPAD